MGDLDFLKLDEVKEFTKQRFNDSLIEIGGKPIFSVDIQKLEVLRWFIEEIYGYVRNDFFNTKSSNYNKVPVKVSEVRSGVERIKNEQQ